MPADTSTTIPRAFNGSRTDTVSEMHIDYTPIYLDYNATSPVAPRVLAAMMPYFSRQYGNASSAHGFGQEGHEAVKRSRARVAALLGCEEDEIIFTSGGSESNNLAVKGVVMRDLPRPAHVITSVVDHPSLLKTCYYLAQRLGTRVTLVPVDRQCVVNPVDVAKALSSDTRMVSIMMANNEVGSIQPIRRIVDLVREKSPDVIVHTDAAQAVGKMAIDVRAIGVDMLTVASHKFCGPKGVGALYVRRGLKLDPLIEGAGHEDGRRSGTENVPGIVGFGAAAEFAWESMPGEAARLQTLRDRLQQGLVAGSRSVAVNGHPTQRLPNTLNISFPGLSGNDILDSAPGVAASTGAACHSGSPEPSSTLLSMGISREIALGALRLSIGRFTTEEEIDRAVRELNQAVSKLGSRAELWHAS